MTIQEFLTKWKFEVEPKPLDEVSERLEGIKHRLEFLGAAEVVRGIFELTERFSGFAEQLGASAASAGLTVEALQKLQFAAGLSGVAAEEVSGGLARMTRTLYEAREGSQEAIASFAKAGISAGQLTSFHTGADAMAAFADRMKGMTDPIQKQALAMQLLGRGSYKMVGFLSQGSKTIHEAGEQAEKMGAVLAGPNLEALRDVEDALSSLWQTVKTFAATVTSYFAPSLTAAVHAFLGFYAVNRKLFLLNAKKWAEEIMYAFGFVYGVVEGLIEKFIAFANAHPVLVKRAGEVALAFMAVALSATVAKKFIDSLKEGFGLLKWFMTPVMKIGAFLFDGLVVGAGLAQKAIVFLLQKLALLVVDAFPAVGEAIFALGAAIEATPIGWVITGIVAALGALVLAANAAYVMLFKHGDFKDTWLGQMAEGVKGAGSWLMDKLGIHLGGGDASSGDAAKQASGVPAALAPPEEQDLGPFPRGLRDAGDSMQNLERIRGLPLVRSLPGIGNAAESAPENYRVEAPVTINVPPGTSPQEVGDKVRQGVQDHLDTVMRQTRASLKTSQAY